MTNFLRKLINILFPSFRINTTLFGKIFVTWTSKKLAISEKNINHTINRFYPAYIKSSKLNGCFVECGVGYGRSALIMESILQMHGDKRDFFFFDSFEGFPNLTSEDLTNSQKARKSQWNYINPTIFLEVLSASKSKDKYSKKYKEDEKKRIHIKKGFFENTLNKESKMKIQRCNGISYLHLDVDLYQSYLICLTTLFPLVKSGGVILFDEYEDKTLKKFPGSKKAIDEFLISNNLNPDKEIKFDLSGKCYMIKK